MTLLVLFILLLAWFCFIELFDHIISDSKVSAVKSVQIQWFSLNLLDALSESAYKVLSQSKMARKSNFTYLLWDFFFYGEGKVYS